MIFDTSSELYLKLSLYRAVNTFLGYKKKQVALIMLIIALQFDVSTSFNM